MSCAAAGPGGPRETVAVWGASSGTSAKHACAPPLARNRGATATRTRSQVAIATASAAQAARASNDRPCAHHARRTFCAPFFLELFSAGMETASRYSPCNGSAKSSSIISRFL
eukprot:3113494-Pyramimonas_sp.AAC.1